MPTFNFADNFSELERRAYRRACHLISRELGVEKRDATINVMRTDIGWQNKALINQIADDHFVLIINNDLSPCEVVYSLGHELIHFWQYVRGDLVDVPDKKLIIWKGEQFEPVDSMLDPEGYVNQPWEAEAFEIHLNLFYRVTVQMPLEERQALSKEFEAKDHPNELIQLLQVLAENSEVIIIM